MRANINGHKTRAKITVDHSLQDIQCHCVSTKITLMPILNRDVSLIFVGRTPKDLNFFASLARANKKVSEMANFVKERTFSNSPIINF